jgi:D-alanine--D-alanine ligase
MDKAVTKRLMASEGVATPPWHLYRLDREVDPKQIAASISERFELPIIVKPNDGGSTIGLSRVTEASGIVPALEKARRESDSILVEKYISGRELTVTVFEGRAYPVVEIRPKSGLYDYEAKYTKGMSEYIAPADVPSELADGLQNAAIRVFEAAGCRGLVRIDFILDDAGDYYCLEVNTLPGMTELSLVPMAVKREGIDFDRLVGMLIESALKR